MNTTSIDKSEGQYPSILYLYLKQLHYFACDSSHLYADGLSLKLLNLYSKMCKCYALWPKTSLKRWLGPQVTWHVP
jgi:hypothetical protein